jgi:prepilin-type N-terminal cleavage/methylation domain-containing protein
MELLMFMHFPRQRQGATNPGNCSAMNQFRAAGFTLVELLVVISIIALLIGILLPAIGSARGAARQLVGGTLHKQLTQAQLAHGYDNKGEYAGVNTSNKLYLAIIPGSTPSPLIVEQLLGDTTPVTPTSWYDWISPILGDAMGFSSNRAERTADIFNGVACPAANRINDEIYGGSSPGDVDDFERVADDRGFNQVSFLAPASFHLWPSENPPLVPIRGNRAGRFRSGFDTPVDVVDSFKPNLDQIARPSEKIIISDGCRFLDDSGILDFDPSHRPGNYGSFLTSTPIFDGSAAFERPESQNGNASADEESYKLSIRHGNFTSMNVSHYDGSVSKMSILEAYRDPTPWFPSDSRFNGTGATQESIDYMADVTADTGESEPTLY